MATTILLADGHGMIRSGLRKLLQSEPGEYDSHVPCPQRGPQVHTAAPALLPGGA